MSDDALTSKKGALWVLPDGPNNTPLFVGCADLDEITAPQGGVELIQCFDRWGRWKTKGEKLTAPDAVTLSITSLAFRNRNWLERLRGKFGLIITQVDSGDALDNFVGRARALIVRECRQTEKAYSGLLNRNTEDDGTRGFSVTSLQPVSEAVMIQGSRYGTAEAEIFSDVALLKSVQGLLPVKYGVATAEATAGKANVYYTSDGGQTWTACAAQPFGNTEDIKSCAIIDMGLGVYRLLVGLKAPAGSQGKVAYSDNWGATWTSVNVGGAAAGHGAAQQGALFALDRYHVWLASTLGYIYFSADAGATWTAQTSGTIAVGTFFCVKFTDDGQYGFAGGANGVVAKTINGGTTWTAATVVTATPDIWCLHVFSSTSLWLGDDDGNIWYSTDAGVTWTKRLGWANAGVGKVQGMDWVNEYVGFIASDNASPVGTIFRTVNGGATWEAVTTPTNSGLTSIAVGDENYAIATGLVNSGTGYLAIVQEY